MTSGTFDKEYDEINGQLYFKETHLQEILKLGRCTVPVEIDTLMMIDSLQMTPHHRSRIVDACRTCRHHRIIITHGTDTMVDTAKVLAEAGMDKTIILTGAMIPYKFGSSDGLFNMGCSLSFVPNPSSRVYVAMNGRYFPGIRCGRTALPGILKRSSGSFR